MKITFHWLRDFVPVEVTAQELAQRLSLAGLEVETLEPVAPPFDQVVVGEVVATERHPNAEKLFVCRVTTDGSNRLQIICGASNVRVGLKVAVALVGATLPNDVHIKRAKLRGVDSEGMLCSARELGLGSEHEGIMELAPTSEVGADLRQALDLDDQTLDVNTTPNRGDCMSVFGIARDFAAASARRFLKYVPPRTVAGSAQEFPLRIEATDACPVVVARQIRGIRPGTRSPLWLQERLRRVGLKSISAVVDVTNLVMMELGQPMHAYDLDKLSTEIVARWARPGEQVTLLDGKVHALDPDCLVIADASGPVGLAGVMGGLPTAISDTTVDIFLEAAHFSPAAIAGRARRFGLFTDAAQRFERGVDPTLPEGAIERATALLLEIVGGQPGPVQVKRAAGAAREPSWVTLRRTRLQRLLGVQIPDLEVEAVLKSISEVVERTAQGWRAQVPPHRFDLTEEVDLIEVVVRLRGFESIDAHDAHAPQRLGEASEAHVSNERLLLAMADRGYREAITYSFVNGTDQRALFPDEPGCALLNPISVDFSEMRVSLWPGLLRACAQNLRRQQSRVRLFEIGRKYIQRAGGLSEVETLAGVSAGPRRAEQWSAAREAIDFYDLKADVSAVLALNGDSASIRFEPGALDSLRPGRSARIWRRDEPIGWIGEVHPHVLKTLDLTQSPYVFELEIERAFILNSLKFKELSKFPSIRRDLAVIVAEDVTFALLQENVSVSASGLLRELRIFDVYRGAGIDLGRKSIALGLILQDSSRTLTDDDADAVVAAVVSRLQQSLSATIRDQ